MRCPVCRAENADERTCRRCRADLSLLSELEQARACALAHAAAAALAGDGAGAVQHAKMAHHFRPDRDSWRWLAVGYFLQRDFTRALAHQRRAV